MGRGRGRDPDRDPDPDGSMMRAGYTVTRAQHRWLRQRAVDLGTDASAVLRDLLTREMQAGRVPAEEVTT